MQVVEKFYEAKDTEDSEDCKNIYDKTAGIQDDEISRDDGNEVNPVSIVGQKRLQMGTKSQSQDEFTREPDSADSFSDQ